MLILGDKMNDVKELIMDNRNLIYSIVHRFKGSDYDDLFQAGCVGLINAYKNYRKEFNVKFTTFAYQYILGEIYKTINNNRNIHMSPENIKLLKAINKASDYLTSYLNRSPSDEEVAEFLEIDLYKLHEIRNMSETESLDYQYDNNELYNFVGDKKLSIDNLLALKDALKSLNEEEKRLIKDRYYNNVTQTELARLYHTNQVKIFRDEQKILCKLKDKMN